MPRSMPHDVAAVVGKLPRWDNRSLLYDKYSTIPEDRRDHESRQVSLGCLQRASEVKEGVPVRLHFLKLLQQSGRPVEVFKARLASRMIVNQSGGVIENGGLCLDKHFGMPCIPGSALKGVALRAARASGAGNDVITKVFGEQDRNDVASKGCVAFLTAYPVQAAGIDLDIVNCHHREYYRGKDPQYANSPDNEAPNPIRFPAVKSGVEFRFAVAAVSDRGDPAMVKQARDWLLTAITELGVGSKTSAGYGWFIYDEAAQAREDEAALREMKKRMEDAKLAAMKPEERYAISLGQNMKAIVEQFGKFDTLDSACKVVLLKLISDLGPAKVLNENNNPKGAKRLDKFRKLCCEHGVDPS